MSPRALAKLHELERKHGGNLSKVRYDDPELEELRVLIFDKKQHGDVMLTDEQFKIAKAAIEDGTMKFSEVSGRLGMDSGRTAKVLKAVRIELGNADKDAEPASETKPRDISHYISKLFESWNLSEMTRGQIANALNSDEQLMAWRDGKRYRATEATSLAYYRGYQIKKTYVKDGIANAD